MPLALPVQTVTHQRTLALLESNPTSSRVPLALPVQTVTHQRTLALLESNQTSSRVPLALPVPTLSVGLNCQQSKVRVEPSQVSNKVWTRVSRATLHAVVHVSTGRASGTPTNPEAVGKQMVVLLTGSEQ